MFETIKKLFRKEDKAMSETNQKKCEEEAEKLVKDLGKSAFNEGYAIINTEFHFHGKYVPTSSEELETFIKRIRLCMDAAKSNVKDICSRYEGNEGDLPRWAYYSDYGDLLMIKFRRLTDEEKRAGKIMEEKDNV